MSNVKQEMKTLSPELHLVPGKSPWYHVGVNFIGPLKKSGKENKYILTLSDYCIFLLKCTLQ